MRPENFIKTIILHRFIVVIGFLFLAQNVFASTITGTVYDNHRNALVDVDVELQDDLSRFVGRAKTSDGGRYEFDALHDGRYTVKVLPFRYDLMETSMEVEITTVSLIPGQESNQFFTQDFYLQPKKGGLGELDVGIVFAQEVPKEAEKVYNSAIKDISKKSNAGGILQLREAVKIFPNYYLALVRLGKELFFKEEYAEAAPMFLKAVEVNPKSAISLYYLGNSLSKLNYYEAATIALNQALVIAPSSVQILYVLGKTESADGKYTAAEKHLLSAKKFSKVGIPEIHWELAQIYGNHLKKYKEAADELEEFLKARPDARDAENIKKVIKDFRDKSNKVS